MGWLRTVFAQSGLWRVTENCIRSIWKSGSRLRTVFTQSGNLEVDYELYSLNLDFREWLRIVFGQFGNLEVNWELYSLNLEFSCNGQNIQIRILMIKTLSVQLFGIWNFPFSFVSPNKSISLTMRIYFSFLFLSHNLFLSLFFLDFEIWILLLELLIFKNPWKFIFIFLWNLKFSFEIGTINFFWKS